MGLVDKYTKAMEKIANEEADVLDKGCPGQGKLIRTKDKDSKDADKKGK